MPSACVPRRRKAARTGSHRLETCSTYPSLAPTAKSGLTPRSLALPPQASPAPVILSFDVEEHYRIEAAAHLKVEPAYRDHCRQRMDTATRWLLGQLAEYDIRATFFVMGEIVGHNPGLIRDIARGGHEVASHG